MISALVYQFNFDTPDIQKSVVNRLLSALDKSGSASSRLAMVSASINALAKSYELDENSEDYTSLEVIALFLAYTAQVARDSQPATATNPAPVITTTGAIKKTKKRKSGWENLKDATPSKPVKVDQIDMSHILAMLEYMNASK